MRPDLLLLDVEDPPSSRHERASWAFERWGGPVLAFLGRMLLDEHEAEAIAGEVFLRFLQCDGTFESAASVRGWLFRVGRNLALDHCKKKRPRLFSQSEATEVAVTLGSSLEAEEAVAAMRGALDRVPEIYRTTIVLRFLHDWSYERISEVEGVSESALRTRVQKGLELIRAELGFQAEQTKAGCGRSGRSSSDL